MSYPNLKNLGFLGRTADAFSYLPSVTFPDPQGSFIEQVDCCVMIAIVLNPARRTSPLPIRKLKIAINKIAS